MSKIIYTNHAHQSIGQKRLGAGSTGDFILNRDFPYPKCYRLPSSQFSSLSGGTLSHIGHPSDLQQIERAAGENVCIALVIHVDAVAAARCLLIQR